MPRRSSRWPPYATRSADEPILDSDRPYLLDVSRLIWRRWAGRQPTGIDRVCLAYLDEFAGKSQAVVQYHGFRKILPAGRSDELFDMLRSPPTPFKPRLVACMVKAFLEPNSPANGRLYLNIGHTGLDQVGVADWVRKTGVRPVYFVHDLIPLTNPEYCRAGENHRHRQRMLTVLDTAHGVIGNSTATIDDLAAFAETKGRTMPPSIAAWLGADRPDIPESDAADVPTFVAVSTIEARKNHMLLLDVWASLVETLGDKAPRLLLIGQRGWECQDVFDRLDKDERLRSVVQELNECSDSELFAHIAAARAMLFPSFAEGFGLPLIEGLAVGTPIIASDLPVFREIGQGVPELLDPRDGGAWMDAVLSYSDPENPRLLGQAERLKTFRLFTWQDHFAAIGPWLAKL